MPEKNTNIYTLATTLRSIEPVLFELDEEAKRARPELQEIIHAAYFKPSQDERIKTWFVKFLTMRVSLWQVIDDVYEHAGISIGEIRTDYELKLFCLGFVAACQVVRLDRLILERVAAHSFIQRKLNEGVPEHNVPRKQYTAIFEAFTEPGKAFKIFQAIKLLDKQQVKIETFKNEKHISYFINNLLTYRSYLDESKKNYLKRSVHYIRHVFRRRGARIKQQAQFGFLEASGRVLSECVNKQNKLVTKDVLDQLRDLLKPGDVFVTRHKYALTNLFLPGFWPHSAMYIGNEIERECLGIKVPEHLKNKWKGDICTFEALKDGVLMRTLENTLSVDGLVVLRPTLSDKGITMALERVLKHEGKKYNFDFDFFRSDRLVCTELPFRAYDEIEDIKIKLKTRAGRPTLSAEDLCDLALETSMFNAIAIFGVHRTNCLVTDAQEVQELLKASYR